MMSELGAALLRKMGRWPQGVRFRLSEWVAKAAYPLAQKRVHVATVNLRKCFPEWSDAQIDQTVRTHLRYFSHGLFDRSLFWFGDKQKIYDHTTYVDEQHWLDAKAQHRPIIFLAPHFIGLDVGGLRINMDVEMATMYQKQRNPVFDALMLEGRMRSGQGHLFSRHDGVRGLVKLLRKNIPLYYLPDMDFGINDAMFSTFFGQTAATLTALPKLAKLTKALIVPCVTRIDTEALARGQTRYKVQFYPAWDGYPGEDEAAAVREMNAFIEARILEEPAQYLWLHKRFKTRPEGEADFYKKTMASHGT